MPANVWDAISNVSNTIGGIWGRKEAGIRKVLSDDPAFQATVKGGTNASALAQATTSTYTGYMVLGGIGLVLLLAFMKR